MVAVWNFRIREGLVVGRPNAPARATSHAPPPSESREDASFRYATSA